MTDPVIVGGARTPIGKLAGSLAGFSATDLGGFAIAAALERSGVAPEAVDYVYVGEVLLGGEGQAPARQAAVKAGIPLSTPSALVNKVCLSGINSIYLAAQMIRAGEADIVVAAGMESMTNAPYLLPKARAGYRYGHGQVIDSLVHDGLFCALEHVLMGEGTERYAASAEIDRLRQDEFAALSHERAANAIKDGVLGEEIAAVEIPQRKGDPVVFAEDEGVRPGTTAESLGKLPAAFVSSGNLTAGNASQISDGASAVVLAGADLAASHGLSVLGRIVGYGQVAGPDPSLLNQPSRAILRALERAGRSVGDLALVEINEAFAAVAVASMGELGIDESQTNVNGGAIALGHPIGASGNRLVLTLAHELRRRGGGLGAAALCGGGGQGDALLLEV
jgi:acetyl-CoA C-acetyltransferase